MHIGGNSDFQNVRDVAQNILTRQAVIDNIVFANMLEKCGTNLAYVIFFAV
jgi:hypothetical protein